MSNTAVAAALLPLTATFCRVSDPVIFAITKTHGWTLTGHQSLWTLPSKLTVTDNDFVLIFRN